MVVVRNQQCRTPFLTRFAPCSSDKLPPPPVSRQLAIPGNNCQLRHQPPLANLQQPPVKCPEALSNRSRLTRLPSGALRAPVAPESRHFPPIVQTPHNPQVVELLLQNASDPRMVRIGDVTAKSTKKILTEWDTKVTEELLTVRAKANHEKFLAKQAQVEAKVCNEPAGR